MVKMSALKGVRGLYRLACAVSARGPGVCHGRGPDGGGPPVRGVRPDGAPVARSLATRGPGGLEPRYPRRRASSKRRAVLEHIRMRGKPLDTARRGPGSGCCGRIGSRLAMGTIQRAFRDLGRALPAADAETRAAAAETLRKGRARGVRPSRRQVRQDCGAVGVSVHRPGRLHPVPGPAAVSAPVPGASLAFLSELRRAFPFPIRRLQCDNGREFPLEFALAVEAAGIRHRYIRPRRPQQNGKVERSHRIDHEEFWGRQQFADFEAATAGLHPVGDAVQLRAPLARPQGADAGRETGGRAAPDRRVMLQHGTPFSRRRQPGSILTRPNTIRPNP